MQFGGLTIGDASDPHQQSVCAAAAEAVRTNNSAQGGLVTQCNAVRANNVLAGRLVSDSYPADGSLRVNLEAAGNRAIASTPALQTALAKVPGAQQRGFKIGVAVRLLAHDANYPAFVRAGLDSDAQAGYALGLAGGTTNAVNPTSSEIPTAVYVAGGAVVVLGLGFLAYKLTR